MVDETVIDKKSAHRRTFTCLVSRNVSWIPLLECISISSVFPRSVTCNLRAHRRPSLGVLGFGKVRLRANTFCY